MKLHALASLFPGMSALEYAGLKADIAAHGVRDAVWTYQGELIDGRHRLRACDELGIACPTREYTGDPAGLQAFVVSCNLYRRHLTESQRAMVAARLVNVSHGTNQHKPKVEAQICASTPTTVDRAAEMLNVAPRSVDSAKQVLSSGTPELVQAVDEGTVRVSRAAQIATAPAAEQAARVEEAKVEKTKGTKKPAAAKPKKPTKPRSKESRTSAVTLAQLKEVIGDGKALYKALEVDEYVKMLKLGAEVETLSCILHGVAVKLKKGGV